MHNAIPEEDLDDKIDDKNPENSLQESIWRMKYEHQKKKIFKKLLSRKTVPVSVLQISKFLYELLRGTKECPYKSFLEMCPAAILARMEPAAR